MRGVFFPSHPLAHSLVRVSHSHSSHGSTGIIWRCRVFKELLRQVATKNGHGSWKLNADLMEADEANGWRHRDRTWSSNAREGGGVDELRD